MLIPNLPQVQYDMVQMTGGFDQVTSAYQLPPGALRDCINFGCRTTGGYYRVPGYERVDGRHAPSEARFVPIAITLASGKSLAVGDVGVFGNIAGTVSYLDPFGEYVGLTETAGGMEIPFVPGNIVVSADIKGQATEYRSGLTLRDLAINNAAAANIYRAKIGVVPGSGPITGVFYKSDRVFAFRDNAGATASVLYGSSPTGWQLIPFGKVIGFSNTAVLPTEGSVITQGGVTAFVRRSAVTTGDLTGGTAAGYFLIDTVAGGAFGSGAATYTGGSTTLVGAATQITLLPGGMRTFSTGTFGAFFGDDRVYGADGLNDAFEFDGTHYFPIPLTMTQKPSYVQAHSNHLFFGVGNSLIHSAIGAPYNFDVLNGAGEIALGGGTVTGLLILPGTQSTAALAVFAKTSTWILYGTSAADWKLVNFNLGIGAWDRSAQNLFDIFSMDDRGVTTMKQSINYGNFDAGTLTYNIRPFIHAQRGKLVCSALNRENGQYRVFFDNGYGLYVTTKPDGLVGHGVVLYPDPVTCSFDGDKADGTNINVFGTATGYVMQNDTGTSFDGKPIAAFLNTNINCVKSPRLRKRFRKCILEVQGSSYIDIQVGYSFEWASPQVTPHEFVDGEGFFTGMAFWDNMIWDAFFWDGRTDDALRVGMDGTGENVQLMIVCEADYVSEFTIPSVIFHYTPRRGNR